MTLEEAMADAAPLVAAAAERLARLVELGWRASRPAPLGEGDRSGDGAGGRAGPRGARSR